ncbi:MAG: late competence development ComFB family protein [Candidatus Desulforudis sp.]|nr:late competence development ComFB family protein [Desulforudis sp.]
MLKNYAEIAAEEVFDEVLAQLRKQRPELCGCRRCREDVLAVALNRLPAKYIATDKGEIFTRVDFSRVGGKAEIIASLIHGFELVNKHPRHQ